MLSNEENDLWNKLDYYYSRATWSDLPRAGQLFFVLLLIRHRIDVMVECLSVPEHCEVKDGQNGHSSRWIEPVANLVIQATVGGDEPLLPQCDHLGQICVGHRWSILSQQRKAQFQESQTAFDYFVKSIGPVVNKWTNFWRICLKSFFLLNKCLHFMSLNFLQGNQLCVHPDSSWFQKV